MMLDLSDSFGDSLMLDLSDQLGLNNDVPDY